jgi:hypothetical protein
MQITYKGVVVEMTPQEFGDIVALGALDDLISLILSMGIPFEAVMNELTEESMGTLFGDSIDEERISNLYRSLKDRDTDDDGF